MEDRFMEMNFASKGVANTGLALGATALGLSVLNGGGGLLGGVLGAPRCVPSEDHCVNRYEAAQASRIAELETRNKLLESNIYTDSKIADIYERLNTKIGVVEAAVNAQAVYNATNTATINCISGQVAQLMALTKTVIPITSICPTPAVATTTTG
jgi:hypothetical protein